MNFEKGQKVRLVAEFEDASMDEDGEVFLRFNGLPQNIAIEAIEGFYNDNAIISVEYSHSEYPSDYKGDTFVFKTAPGHQNLYLEEKHIVLADEGEDE